MRKVAFMADRNGSDVHELQTVLKSWHTKRGGGEGPRIHGKSSDMLK